MKVVYASSLAELTQVQAAEKEFEFVDYLEVDKYVGYGYNNTFHLTEEEVKEVMKIRVINNAPTLPIVFDNGRVVYYQSDDVTLLLQAVEDYEEWLSTNLSFM